MTRQFSAVLALCAALTGSVAMAQDAVVTSYLSALEAGNADDWGAARAQIKGTSGIAPLLVRWHALRDGDGTFADYKDFITNHSEWPSQITLTRRGEATLGQAPNAQAVIDYFYALEPRTAAGIIALRDAYLELGDPDKAQQVLVAGWLHPRLELEDQAALIDVLKPELSDHIADRVDVLLWNGTTKTAEPLLPMLDGATKAQAEARIALRRRSGDAAQKLQAVPVSLATAPSIRLEQFLNAVRRDKDEAVDIALEQSRSAALLGEPDKWASQRRSMVRYEMREGDAWRAYRLASQHFLTVDDGENFSDLEWLSGYIALRKLGDPAKALTHLETFESSIESPISVARAGYWRGLALEDLGQIEQANAAFRMAATQQTAFYGLLAAEKLGVGMDAALIGAEEFPDWRTGAFLDDPVVQAAQLFHRSGNRIWALINLIHVAETQDRETMGMMADMALEWDEPFIALHIAKTAAKRGIVLNRAYFPDHPLSKLDLPASPEFNMSIARRESEFNPAAQSGVGARGLMQLMPDTAKAVSGGLNVNYSLSKLTSDWQYNALLGSNYLAELEGEFGPSPVMIAAAYNAGPSRPEDWMDNIGDPRLGEIDVIDWIEQIPFRETRNYVMRVTESLPVYRARLSGQVEPIQFTKLLIGEKPLIRPSLRPDNLLERQATEGTGSNADENNVVIRRAGVTQSATPSGPSAPSGPRPLARPSAPATR